MQEPHHPDAGLIDVSITNFTNGFIHSGECLVDNPNTTIAQRYGMILTCLPEARRRPIHADFEDAFQRIYVSGTHDETAAAIDLNRLRTFFYMMLYNNEIGRAHVNIWHVANAEKWMMKLTDRYKQTTHEIVNYDTRTYAPPKYPQKAAHTWLN